MKMQPISFPKSQEPMKFSVMKLNVNFMILREKKKQKDSNSKSIYKLNQIRGGDRRQKGPNNKFTVKATLEELYKGAQSSFNINRNVYCSKCKGSGAEGGEFKTCPTCKGKGQVVQNINMGMM